MPTFIGFPREQDAHKHAKKLGLKPEEYDVAPVANSKTKRRVYWLEIKQLERLNDTLKTGSPSGVEIIGGKLETKANCFGGAKPPSS